jgi:phosphatidylinositol alpha-1,6-mannosyltransferase
MRILIVTQDFPPDLGGIPTTCGELAGRLHALGHAVCVVCPERPGAKAQDASLPYPVRRARITPSLLWSWWLLRLGAIARDFAADVVLYAQWQSAVWQFLPGNRAARAIPQATLVSGPELHRSVFGPFTRPLADRVLRRVDLAIADSRAVRDRLRERRPTGECPIVHPGVDAPRFAAGRRESVRARLGWTGCVVAGVVARLVPRKNIAALLRAAAALRGRHPELRVLIAGDGPERRRLRTLGATLGLDDICHFAGAVAPESLADHYAALDVFVMPSVETADDLEGFAIVFLEAGAVGVASLAYRCGGVSDAVKDRRTGLLVTPGDEAGLQAALSELLSNERLRRRLGIEARARASALTWTANARAIADLLAGLLPPPPPATGATTPKPSVSPR